MEPLEFRFELAEFNLNLLSINRELLRNDPDLLREAIKTYFDDYFRNLGGEISVIADRQYIRVTWLPAASNDIEKLLGVAINLLKEGAYKQAEPILKSLSTRFPENFAVHFNYGMLLSDQGLLDEAIHHLSTAVRLAPGHADSWNALGVAYHRKGTDDEAIRAFGPRVERPRFFLILRYNGRSFLQLIALRAGGFHGEILSRRSIGLASCLAEWRQGGAGQVSAASLLRVAPAGSPVPCPGASRP